jgi:carbonic anhydrase/acetyltransferase-like protein (isoleucine patch superfamily)
MQMPIYELPGKKPRIAPSAYVHPDANLIGEVSVGNNSFIAPGVVIRADFAPIIIKERTSIQDNAVIHVNPSTQVIVENDVIVGHSVCLHDVHIKSRCVIGMDSILLLNVICEEKVIVASGAVVTSGTHIPTGKLVAGNPARILKDATPGSDRNLIFDR